MDYKTIFNEFDGLLVWLFRQIMGGNKMCVHLFIFTTRTKSLKTKYSMVLNFNQNGKNVFNLKLRCKAVPLKHVIKIIKTEH